MISSLWTYRLCHKLLVIVKFTLICQKSYLKSWNSHLITRSDSCWRTAILANATSVQDNSEKVLDVTPGWLGCISMCADANCGGIKALCSSVLSFKGVRTYSLLFQFPLMWALEELEDSSSQLQKEPCLQNQQSLDGCLWVDHIQTYVYLWFLCWFSSCEWPQSWDNLIYCLSKLGWKPCHKVTQCCQILVVLHVPGSREWESNRCLRGSGGNFSPYLLYLDAFKYLMVLEF